MGLPTYLVSTDSSESRYIGFRYSMHATAKKRPNCNQPRDINIVAFQSVWGEKMDVYFRLLL